MVPTHAPAVTYVLVLDVMATFCAFGTVLIFTPPWYFYLIPVVLIIPTVVILSRRWIHRRRLKAELAGLAS